MRRPVPRRTTTRGVGRRLVLGLGTLALIASTGCTGDGDGAGEDAATTTGPSATIDPFDFGLAVSGEESCSDPTGDLGMTSLSSAPPPVDQPGLDIVEASAVLDDEVLRLHYEMAGPIDPVQLPYFVVSLVEPDDTRGFDLTVNLNGGVWTLSTLRHGLALEETEVVPSAVPVVDGAVLDVTVPRADLPAIERGLVPFYGTFGRVIDDAGNRLDLTGAVTTNPATEADAIDDCI